MFQFWLMVRKAISALIGAAAAVALLFIGIYLQLRFTSFGEFIRVAGQENEHDLVNRFGDPIDALGRYVSFMMWVVCPLCVFLSAVLARYIARRSGWYLAASSALPLAAMLLIAKMGFGEVAASCFYLLVGFSAMYLVESWQARRATIS